MKLLCQWTGAVISDAQFTEMTDRKNGWYVEYVERMTPEDVLPGALDFVKACREAGLKCAIGSASKNCQLVLARTGLGPWFDAVSDGTVVTRAKPDPGGVFEGGGDAGLAPFGVRGVRGRAGGASRRPRRAA